MCEPRRSNLKIVWVDSHRHYSLMSVNTANDSIKSETGSIKMGMIPPTKFLGGY